MRSTTPPCLKGGFVERFLFADRTEAVGKQAAVVARALRMGFSSGIPMPSNIAHLAA